MKDAGMEGGPGTPPEDEVAAAENWRLRRESSHEEGTQNIRPRWNELLRTRALWQEGLWI